MTEPRGLASPSGCPPRGSKIVTSLSSERLHASCVAIGGHAVLIEGLSGAGKSDLALRLIDRGARLVSDDYTLVSRNEMTLIASAPETIVGKMEVRGLGIVEMNAVTNVPVSLIVSLADQIDRMPADDEHRLIAGLPVPLVALNAFEASAPIKVELALQLRGLGVQ